MSMSRFIREIAENGIRTARAAFGNLDKKATRAQKERIEAAKKKFLVHKTPASCNNNVPPALVQEQKEKRKRLKRNAQVKLKLNAKEQHGLKMRWKQKMFVIP